MGDDIPQAGDLSPGDAGIALSRAGRKLLDRFTDDLEIQEYCVRRHVVFEDLVLRATGDVPRDLRAPLLDVLEK